MISYFNKSIRGGVISVWWTLSILSKSDEIYKCWSRRRHQRYLAMDYKNVTKCSPVVLNPRRWLKAARKCCILVVTLLVVIRSKSALFNRLAIVASQGELHQDPKTSKPQNSSLFLRRWREPRIIIIREILPCPIRWIYT